MSDTSASKTGNNNRLLKLIIVMLLLLLLSAGVMILDQRQSQITQVIAEAQPTPTVTPTGKLTSLPLTNTNDLPNFINYTDPSGNISGFAYPAYVITNEFDHSDYPAVVMAISMIIPDASYLIDHIDYYVGTIPDSFFADFSGTKATLTKGSETYPEQTKNYTIYTSNDGSAPEKVHFSIDDKHLVIYFRENADQQAALARAKEILQSFTYQRN